MSTPNFANLLDRNVGTVEKPKPLPEGSYTFVISEHETGESNQKKTPFVRFMCQPVEAYEDVDDEALEAFGGQAAMAKKKIRYTFYLTEDSLFRLDTFVGEHLGLTGKLSEAIGETTGASFVGRIVHKPNEKDLESPFAEIDSTAQVSVE